MTSAQSLPYASTASLQPALPSLAEATTRQKIHQTASSFESTFLSTVLNSMFEGVTQQEPFGGGAGEQAFRSFLNDAMAKQMVGHGGLGLSKPIEKEMLRMQGLPALPVSSIATTAALNAPAASRAPPLRNTAYGRTTQ